MTACFGTGHKWFPRWWGGQVCRALWECTLLRRKSNMKCVCTAVHLWTEKCNFSHICVWNIRPGGWLKRHLGGGWSWPKKWHWRLSTLWNLKSKPVQNGPKSTSAWVWDSPEGKGSEFGTVCLLYKQTGKESNKGGQLGGCLLSSLTSLIPLQLPAHCSHRSWFKETPLKRSQRGVEEVTWIGCQFIATLNCIHSNRCHCGVSAK